MSSNKKYSVLLLLFAVWFLEGCAGGKSATKGRTEIFSVFQFNIWQEGTSVKDGFEGIVEQIAFYKPDFVTLSEVRNYQDTDFQQRLVSALHERGEIYHYFHKTHNVGLLSKFPILEGSREAIAGGAAHKITVEIKGRKLTLYSFHPDYRNYAEYLPRGYDGDGNQKISPVTDADSILAEDARSGRPRENEALLADIQTEISRGRLVIVGGDFNEASHLDWTERTKNLYDRNGAVVPWRASSLFYAHGFRDSFREAHPDELKVPGFTWVVAHPWLHDRDERDRIDFIYYLASPQLKVVESHAVGPLKSFVGDNLVTDPDYQHILPSSGVWPSDHRGVLSVFKLKKP